MNGYGFIFDDEPKSVSVLSACPPSLPRNVQNDMLLDAFFVSMFVAPLLERDSNSTIVLGDCCYGPSGLTYDRMSGLIAEAMDQELIGVEIKLDHLYKDI